MSAFILASPLPHRKPPCRRAFVTARQANRHNDNNFPPSSVSLDPFHGFESFCHRTQQALARDTATVDGLGTFAPPPQTLHHSEPQRKKRLEMRGGRAFRAAVVDVWRSTELVPTRNSRVITYRNHTGDVEYLKESVGISLNLVPRDAALPCLRADAHYFQIGAGRVAWWFAGTADLSVGSRASPTKFENLVASFLNTWERLRRRHRVESRAQKSAFLDACLGIDDDVPVERVDRETSFNFISEVVDTLLPSYLPLLEGRGHDVAFEDWKGYEVGEALTQTGAFGNETVETFCISGGASCESTTLRANPLGSWRFSLAPSTMTAAGRVYDALRSDKRGAQPSLMYIDTT